MVHIRKKYGRPLLLAGMVLAAVVPPGGARAQSERILYDFQSGSDGAVPFAGLVKGNGDFYGTTAYGGATGHGTIFSVTPDGTETVLHAFAGYPNDGASPQSDLVLDAEGNLYGTTAGGGANADGVVFKLAPDGTETLLHSFAGTDGANPEAGLVMGSGGVLYGTTYGGGSHNRGTVFEVAPDDTETVLHSFGSAGDGVNPSAGLAIDKDGNLFGVTVFGGADGYGTVYKLAPDGTESVLYSFAGATDGANPAGRVVVDRKDNLYGTVPAGGANDHGAVFKLSHRGVKTLLYSFASGADGAQPLAGLVMDGLGNLYGTTFVGGGANYGTVFEVARDGTETVLHAFAGGSDGAYPSAVPLVDRRGRIFGTTQTGGSADDGVVFKLKR